MSVKIGGPRQPMPPQIQSQTTSKATTSQPSMPKQIEANPAWEQLTAVQHSIPSQASQGTGTTLLRQQIALMSGSAQAQLINPNDLAQQFGINSQDLILSQGANIQFVGGFVQGGYQEPSVATSTGAQSAPLASSHTPSGPTTHPARKEAKAAFERFLEQSHAMFDTKSDNMARELSKNPRLLEALTTAEKARLIEGLNSGIKTEADEEAISRILDSAQNKADFASLVDMCGGPDRLASMVDGAERRHFEFLWDKFATETDASNNPVRKEARAAFEKVLKQHRSFLDSDADRLARKLVNDPQKLAMLSPTEKGRLIQILNSGYTSEADEEAIVKLLRSSKDSTDFWTTVQIAGGPQFINSAVDWKEQSTFNYLMEKFSQPFSPAPDFRPGLRPEQGAIPPQAQNPLQNSWSMPPTNSYGVNNSYQEPPYHLGTATGLGQPYDFGFGTQQTQHRGILGNIFDSLREAAAQTLQDMPSAMMMNGNLMGMATDPLGSILNSMMQNTQMDMLGASTEMENMMMDMLYGSLMNPYGYPGMGPVLW